jgi:hypothetical protein
MLLFMAMPKVFSCVVVQTLQAGYSLEVVGVACVCTSIQASYVAVVTEWSEVNQGMNHFLKNKK